MKDINIGNFIRPKTAPKCHSGAKFASYIFEFEYSVSESSKILLRKKLNEDKFEFDEKVIEIAEGEGKVSIPIHLRNLSGDIELEVCLFQFDENDEGLRVATSAVHINECPSFKNILSALNHEDHTPTPTPTLTEDVFIYNPSETPTPTPFDIEFGSSTLNTFGDWSFVLVRNGPRSIGNARDPL